MTREGQLHHRCRYFFVDDTKQHALRSVSSLDQLQERVLGEQPPSAFRPPLEDDLGDSHQGDGGWPHGFESRWGCSWSAVLFVRA
jgi:hypothetical protein